MLSMLSITTKTMLSKVEAEFLAHCVEIFGDTFEGEEYHFTDVDRKTVLMNQDQIEALYQKLESFRLSK